MSQYLAHIDEFEIFQANQEPRLLCYQNKNKPLTIKDKIWFSKFCDACDVSFKVADDEKVVSAAHITEEEGEEDDVDLV